jgi:hypothetical protein
MDHVQNNNISITAIKEWIIRVCGQTGLPQTSNGEIVMTKETSLAKNETVTNIHINGHVSCMLLHTAHNIAI